MKKSKVSFGDLGVNDGPPILNCQQGERLRSNAIKGSQQLASRLESLGLRP